MNVTIVGWYGTETIGDRAILAGLISFFNKSFDNFNIKLGSLYPFFSERTINEDYAFYKEIIGKDFGVDIFNSKDSKALSNAIKGSDLLIMGGGPLMDLSELFMVEYAFKKAKSYGCKTALLGCGVGPLFHKKYKKSVIEIAKNSDLIILRDSQSKHNLQEMYKEFGLPFEHSHFQVSYDPAVECVLEYGKYNEKQQQDYIAVNLRAFPVGYSQTIDAKTINQKLQQFIESLANKFEQTPVRLIPMHYFHIGGDDREFLNSIALELNRSNIAVQNKPLTLKETIAVFSNAKFNIGMRFHSVVIQTIASGKNYVLDYTEPKKGKINGFIQDIDTTRFYDDRYISLQEDSITSEIVNNIDDIFSFTGSDVRSVLACYAKALKELCE